LSIASVLGFTPVNERLRAASIIPKNAPPASLILKKPKVSRKDAQLLS
jgi:hypothetical protein